MPQDYSSCFPANTPPTLYTSTGATTAFPIGFPYQKTSDVVVYTGTADPANWVITPTTDYAVSGNPSQVVFTAAPNADVLIMRRTELCDERIHFQAGQSIRAQDLETNFQQQLFLTQELYEYLSAQAGGGPLIPGADADQRFLQPNEVLGGNGIDTVVAGQNVTVSQSQVAGVAGNYVAADITVDNMGRITAADDGDVATLFNAGDGIELTAAPANRIEVDLAGTSGLEFTGGELRVDAGSGIVLDASGTNVRGNQTQLGTIQFGAGDTYTFPTADGTPNQVLTTNGAGALRWETPIGGGGGGGGSSVPNTTGLNSVAVPADREPGEIFIVSDSTNIDGAVNPGVAPNEAPNPVVAGLPAAPSDGWGATINVLVSWNSTDDGWSFVGYRATTPDARYVLNAGDTMSGNLLFNDGTANTAINVNGSAVFNENGDDVDFRVESDTNPNMLFVDGADNRVGIGTNNPQQPLDVNGNIRCGSNLQIRTGGNVDFSNTANNQVVSVNADDATDTYTVTLPPTAPTANGQVLSVASGTSDAELQWETLAPSINGIRVEDDGAQIVATAQALNFTGGGVTVTDSGSGEAEVAIPEGGVSVQDEGAALATKATTLNFTGAGVVASGAGATKTINIPASSGSSNTDPGGTGDGSGGIGNYANASGVKKFLNEHFNRITFKRGADEYKCPTWLTHGRGNQYNSGMLAYGGAIGAGYIDNSGQLYYWGQNGGDTTAPNVATYFRSGSGGPYYPRGSVRHAPQFRDGGYTRFALNGDPDYAKFATDIDGNALNLPAGEIFAGLESAGMSITQGIFLTRNGLIYHTGYNGYGQAGRGVTTQYHFPTLIPLYDTDGTTLLTGKDRPKMRQISNSATSMYYQTTVNFTMALDVDGNVYTWGYNGYGQLGNGTVTSNYKAIKMDPAKFDNKKVMWIQAYYNQSLAITEDGYIYVWGINNYNAMGNNLTTVVNEPRCLNSTGFFDVKSFAPASDAGWTTNQTNKEPTSTSSATGQGIKCTITFSAGVPTITILDMGNGKYAEDDTITFDAATIGGTEDLVITLQDLNVMREKVIVHAHWLGYTTQSLMMLDGDGKIYHIGYNNAHGDYSGFYKDVATTNNKHPVEINNQATTTLSDNQKVIAMFCGYDIAAYCNFAITDGGDSNQPKVYGWGYNGTGLRGIGFGRTASGSSTSVQGTWGLEEIQFDFPTTGETNVKIEEDQNGQFDGTQYDATIQKKLRIGKISFVAGSGGGQCGLIDEYGQCFFAGSASTYNVMSGTDGYSYTASTATIQAPYVANRFDFFTPAPYQQEAMTSMSYTVGAIGYLLGAGKSGSLYGTAPYLYWTGMEQGLLPPSVSIAGETYNYMAWGGWRRLALGT